MLCGSSSRYGSAEAREVKHERMGPIAVYMIAMALITLVSVYLAAETLSEDIAEELRQEDQRLAEEG